MIARAGWAAPVFAALLLAAGAAPAAEPAVRTGTVAKDAVWEGTVRVEGTVTVAREALLTVKPGTVVLFGKGAGIVVEGGLVARGAEGALIRFASAAASPAAGDWTEIRFSGSRRGSALARCAISHGSAVRVEGCAPEIRDCTIADGQVGVIVEAGARPVISGNVISRMAEAGVGCGRGGSPEVTGNTISDCRLYGVFSTQDSHPRLRDNIVSGCGTGFSFTGVLPPVEGNRLSGNKVGISANMAGPGQVIRGNRLERNGTGLLCANFSSPQVERNEIVANDNGLVCVRSSSPLVRNNEIARGARGIACYNLCNPRILANDIHANGTGIYLTLSSYAVVNGNNIFGNGVQVALGNMSSDWEARVGKKPERGRQAQQAGQAGRGMGAVRGGAARRGDGAVIMRSVDATGNWWGEAGTAEMERKGPDADIEGFRDWHDVPTLTYEGYPGEYAQDRIKYEGWKRSRIEGAGIR